MKCRKDGEYHMLASRQKEKHWKLLEIHDKGKKAFGIYQDIAACFLCYNFIASICSTNFAIRIHNKGKKSFGIYHDMVACFLCYNFIASFAITSIIPFF
jgi:hypothetical protein